VVDDGMEELGLGLKLYVKGAGAVCHSREEEGG
jgi:hypothetical protein